jgi:N-acetylglutamate synthase-like GNAT family acetyltransferase
MKFIYAKTEDAKAWFDANGFNKIQVSFINGEEVSVYENKRDITIPDTYKKIGVFWTNDKLLF